MNKRKSYPVPFHTNHWIDTPTTYMLHQDFGNHLVPNNTGDTYRLSSDDVPLHSFEDAFFLPETNRNILDGWIEGIATRLLTNHEVWLEVAFDDLKGEALFQVFPVDGQIEVVNKSMIQRLPTKEDLPQWYQNIPDWPEQVELESARMIHVVLPNTYPTHVLTQVVTGLARTNEKVVPSWYMEGLTGVRTDIPSVEVNELERTRKLYVAQVALPIGWTGREILALHRPLNEYFRLWRELRFLHFRSAMRRCAEQALEQVLEIVAKNIGVIVSVTARGTYTPDDVERLIQEFEEGKLPFSKAYDIIYERIGDDDHPPRRIA